MRTKREPLVCCLYSEMHTITWEHTKQAIDMEMGGVVGEQQQLPVRLVPALCCRMSTTPTTVITC